MIGPKYDHPIFIDIHLFVFRNTVLQRGKYLAESIVSEVRPRKITLNCPFPKRQFRIVGVVEILHVTTDEPGWIFRGSYTDHHPLTFLGHVLQVIKGHRR